MASGILRHLMICLLPALALVSVASSLMLRSPALNPAQGALGVNTALFSFSFVVFNFLATATTPLIAAAVSAGNREQVPLRSAGDPCLRRRNSCDTLCPQGQVHPSAQHAHGQVARQAHHVVSMSRQFNAHYPCALHNMP